MGKFNEGDRVVSKDGDLATVNRSREYIDITWDAQEGEGTPIFGTWPEHYFELAKPRKFALGQFVRVVADDDTNGEVGMVFEDDGDDEDCDPYHVALYDDDESEEWYSAYELIPWLPKVGERVIEASVEDDDETGVVIGINEVGAIGGVDDISVRVLWESFPHAQDWLVSDLEPFAEDVEDDNDEIEVGDTVTYTNPIFVDTYEAAVVEVFDNVIRVNFKSGPPSGLYPVEFFSKAA